MNAGAHYQLSHSVQTWELLDDTMLIRSCPRVGMPANSVGSTPKPCWNATQQCRDATKTVLDCHPTVASDIIN